MVFSANLQHDVDTIRDPTADNENYQQLLLLEHNNLHNISQDFNIDYATKQHKNGDAINVKLSVNEMKVSTESPTLQNKIPIIVNKNKIIQSQTELILSLSQKNFNDHDRENIENKIEKLIIIMNSVGKISF